MLVIIEGLDRTGKTTLAEALARELGLNYTHFSKPERHPLVEYSDPISAPVLNDVMDRFHVGERVWPKIFGRDSEFDDEMAAWIDLVAASRGGVMVFSHRNIEEMIASNAFAGEPINADQARVALELFARAARQCMCFVLHWRLGQDPHRIAVRAAHRARCAAEVTSLTPHIIGSTMPQLLLVGEQCNGGVSPLPFMPFKNTSGHFLMSELITSGLGRRTAIVNALTPDGECEPLDELYQELGCPAVVALGNVARDRLDELGIQHGHVPHPQYVRRFERSKGHGWYAMQIITEAERCISS